MSAGQAGLDLAAIGGDRFGGAGLAGAAWQAWSGAATRGQAGPGRAWTGAAGGEGRGAARHGVARQGSAGAAWLAGARQGWAGLDPARDGAAWQAWRAARGWARHGVARQAGRGVAWPGRDRLGKAGEARLGSAWLGECAAAGAHRLGGDEMRGPATGLEPAVAQRNDAWVLPFPITSALARHSVSAKMKRRPMPAGASGSMRHAPSQALAEDYRDPDPKDQDRPLISEDGQPVLRRVGLPRSRP
jgi:hypothetical protein